MPCNICARKQINVVDEYYGGTISIWLGIGWSSFEMRAILFYVVKG